MMNENLRITIMCWLAIDFVTMTIKSMMSEFSWNGYFLEIYFICWPSKKICFVMEKIDRRTKVIHLIVAYQRIKVRARDDDIQERDLDCRDLEEVNFMIKS